MQMSQPSTMGKFFSSKDFDFAKLLVVIVVYFIILFDCIMNNQESSFLFEFMHLRLGLSYLSFSCSCLVICQEYYSKNVKSQHFAIRP